MDCKVTFFPTHCVFQDQGSGMMSGRAKKMGRIVQLRGTWKPDR